MGAIRLSAYRQAAKPGLMIIPMIDIIFFLLVFYMMTTLYMAQQHALVVRLPAAADAAAPAAPHVTVTVTADNAVYVEAARVDPAELAGVIRGYAQTDGMRFSVNADRDARHGTVVSVLDALRRAGVASTNIAVSLAGGGP